MNGSCCTVHFSCIGESLGSFCSDPIGIDFLMVYSTFCCLHSLQALFVGGVRALFFGEPFSSFSLSTSSRSRFRPSGVFNGDDVSGLLFGKLGCVGDIESISSAILNFHRLCHRCRWRCSPRDRRRPTLFLSGAIGQHEPDR